MLNLSNNLKYLYFIELIRENKIFLNNFIIRSQCVLVSNLVKSDLLLFMLKFKFFSNIFIKF